MDNHYPIEQLARSTSTRFQMGFARMTMHLLPGFRDVGLEPSADGLRILAANEDALALPGEAIRQIHADEVDISEPRVRLLYADRVLEPIMWVRAASDRNYTEVVIQDLVRRTADIEEVDSGSDYAKMAQHLQKIGSSLLEVRPVGAAHEAQKGFRG